MAKTKRKTKSIAFHEAVRMISPGTKIREAISMMLQSRLGALLCIGDPKKLADLSDGGVELNAACTPQLLYELSKMDGAIILNEDGSTITYANRFLTPRNSIVSHETGTRHIAAERMAKQAKCAVVAVSERRSSVTLYVQDTRHVLDSLPTLLNKSAQALQTLEKYISSLIQSMLDLSTREFEDMVTIFDVCKAIQRCEMSRRIASEIEPYILELGTEGRLIELQLRELSIPLDEARLITRDYCKQRPSAGPELVQQRIEELSQDELISLEAISQALGYGANLRGVDTYLSSRGYRVLSQTRRLTPQIIENLVNRFGTLQQIMRAPKDELVAVEGVGEVLAERVRLSLNNLRSQLALDRGRT